MKLLGVAAIAAAAVFFGACSSKTDNPTNPNPTSPEYITAKSGTVYQFDQFALTGTATSAVAIPNGSGTSTVAPKAVIGGREAQVVIDAFVDATSAPSTDTNQYHEANGIISKWYRIGSPALGNLPAISAGKVWVVVSHPTQTSWTALDTSIQNVAFNYNGIPLTGTVRMKILGSKLANDNVAVDGKTINSVHTRFDIEASIQSEVWGVGTVAINLSFSEEYWFGKGVGLVRYDRLPFVLPTTPPIIPAPIDIPGRRITLKSYVLAP
jgi:hypothetical protein